MTEIAITPPAPAPIGPIVTGQPYSDPRDWPPTVQLTDDGVIIDPAGLTVGEPRVVLIDRQPIFVLKRGEAGPIDFFCLPPPEQDAT